MKQQTALAILKQGHHVFLTGQAGAGKTYLLNEYIRYLHRHGIKVAITASTGIAATHMHGTTIHAWSGIGIKHSFEKQDFDILKKKEAIISRLKEIKVLIIDEVSMLHARQLDLVDEVLRYVRDDERAFGGIQVVLSGDFFQLPPIGNKDESSKDKFAFMSKVWIRLATNKSDNISDIKVCYLSEQYRQHEKQCKGLSLNDILNQIRTQTVSYEAIDTLLATKNNDVHLNRVRLYTHNLNVDKINQDELEAIDDKPITFEAIEFGDKNNLDILKKTIRASDSITLKKGAKVMFIKNNPAEGYYNGMMGQVIDFEKDEGMLPRVRLNNGKQILVDYEDWSIEGDNEGMPLASYSQIPLSLAWAITVHKSQGMTLEAAEIDLSKTFEMGQGYVALSRVKSLAGLKLLGLNNKSLMLDDFAISANRRFLQLSDDCQACFDSQSLEKRQQACDDFLKKNATHMPTTPKSLNGANQGDNRLAQTYQNTLMILKNGQKDKKTITDIAKECALARSTIITHITKLLDEGFIILDEIAYLLPDNKTINKVIKTAQKLIDTVDKDITLNMIHHELDKKISYDVIKLSLLVSAYQDSRAKDNNDE